MTTGNQVKEKVIQMHLDGMGRKKISEMLKESIYHVSEATVSKIIKDYKHQRQQTSIPPEVETNLVTSTINNNINSVASIEGTGANKVENKDNIDFSSSKQIDITPIQNSKYCDKENVPLSTTNETKLQDCISGSSKQISYPMPSNTYRCTSYREPEAKTEEKFIQPQDEIINIGIDWDKQTIRKEEISGYVWQSVFWRRIVEEKKLRAEQMAFIAKERRDLDRERISLNEDVRDLDNDKADLELRNREMAQREQNILIQQKDLDVRREQFEPLVQLDNDLKSIGLATDALFPLIFIIHEKSLIEHIDTKSTTKKITEELQSLQTTHKILNEQIAKVKVVSEQQELALKMLDSVLRSSGQDVKNLMSKDNNGGSAQY